MACLSFTSNAQKIAHIDFDSLIKVMPQYDTAIKKLEEQVKVYKLQLATMENEYKQKNADFEANKDKWTDLIKGIKQQELADLAARYQEFAQQADMKIQEEQTKLLKPVYAMAKKAISDVAKEKGYKLVIDSSGDELSLVLYSEPSDDIFNLVKAKLGIK
ncbi:MAG: OmpH family outer membrane protein [Bacteroidota bacterium]